MATPKIETNEQNNSEDQTKAPETPPITPPAPPAPPAEQSASREFAAVEKSPSDWEIVPSEEDEQIVATNNRSGTVFKGTVSEFCAALRG